jgi:4-cresol dehydrogenase (hydroxylating)
MILFDTRDADEAASAYRVAIQLAEKARKLGWNEYRGHPALIEHIARTYDFNDHSIYKAYGRIKDALDPNGILSPGNHGIWPGAYRDR